jgi:cytochrome c5
MPKAEGGRRKEEWSAGKPAKRNFFFILHPSSFILGCALALPATAATPEEQYLDRCAVCHLPGANGAPKVGDKTDWTRRLRSGMSMVYRNALEGVPNTAMMARGGTDLPEAELKAVVDYMIKTTALPAGALREAARYDKLGITDRDFIRRDANFDGVLSREELKDDPVLLKSLARFDRNKDGRLDEAEYREAEATLERERVAVEVDDAALTTAVREALAKIRGLDLQYAKVEVRGGTVSMVGIVEHADVAIRANDAVKRIAGVRKIDNRLVSGHQIGWD